MEGEQRHEEEEKETILDELLTRIPPEAEKMHIQEIIGRTNFLGCDTAYSARWEDVEEHEEGVALLSKKLKDGILLDLGGGHGDMGGIVDSEKYYINVDNTHLLTKGKPRPGYEWNKPSSQGFVFRDLKDRGTIEVNADMLTFLEYISDDSIDGIAMNGIDHLIIDNPDYHSELAKQVKRVLKPKGVLFGNNSKAIDILKNDKKFKVDWAFHWSKILEKNDN